MTLFISAPFPLAAQYNNCHLTRSCVIICFNACLNAMDAMDGYEIDYLVHFSNIEKRTVTSNFKFMYSMDLV